MAAPAPSPEHRPSPLTIRNRRAAAWTLASGMLFEHGFAEKGWTLTFSKRSRNIGGWCNDTTKEIVLALSWVDALPPKKMADVIIHEFAHALAGCKHDHDEVWVAKFKELGGSGRATYDLGKHEHLTARWKATCAAGHELYTAACPRRVWTCATCSPERDFTHMLAWTPLQTGLKLSPSYVKMERSVKRATARGLAVTPHGKLVRKASPKK